MGLGVGSWPSDLMIRLLEFCHVSSGLPWWLSIGLLTVILRVSLFPVFLKTTRNAACMPYLADQQKEIMTELKTANDKLDWIEARKLQAKLWSLYGEWGYSPFVNLFGLLQLPVFFAMFRTCNRCANLPVPGWEDGGSLWFTDLTAIDPYFILPTVSGLTTAATIWVTLDWR